MANYAWFLITIPLLAIAIYYVAKKITPTDKAKNMTGISILAILFGAILIYLALARYETLKVSYLIFGIIWVLLGAGRLLYDYKK